MKTLQPNTTSTADQAAVLANAVTSRTVSSVVSNTVGQLETARKTVQESTGNYTLGDVSISIKGIFVPGENDTMELAFPAQNVEGAAYGTIDFVLTDGDASTPTEPVIPDGFPVPDVTGYTRSLALRKLAEAGLLANTSIISVDPRGPSRNQIGRVVRQLPAVGAQVSPGTTIRLFLGKPDRSL